jgi:hypothetical protein
MAGDASGMKTARLDAFEERLAAEGLRKGRLLDLHIVLSRGVEWVE